MFSPPAEAVARDLYEAPVTPQSSEILGYIRYHNAPNRDNSRLLDVQTAIEEANLYKQFGGVSLVDATSIGIARDPLGLARISRATGVNVIMGAAFYVNDAHPPYVAERSAEQLAERIVRDVTEGVDDTGIRSGIIGEVGCLLAPDRQRAQGIDRRPPSRSGATGAPILIHPGRDEQSPPPHHRGRSTPTAPTSAA